MEADVFYILVSPFSAEKCFYLGNSTYGHFRLDSICKSTLLDFFLMWGFFVSACSGVWRLFVFSLYIFLSTLPMRILFFPSRLLSPRSQYLAAEICVWVVTGICWSDLFVAYWNHLTLSGLVGWPIVLQVFVQLVPLSALAMKKYRYCKDNFFVDFSRLMKSISYMIITC